MNKWLYTVRIYGPEGFEQDIWITAINSNDAERTVSCTLKDGFRTGKAHPVMFPWLSEDNQK